MPRNCGCCLTRLQVALVYHAGAEVGNPSHVATYNQIPLVDPAPPTRGGPILSLARSAAAVSRVLSSTPQERDSVRAPALLRARIRFQNGKPDGRLPRSKRVPSGARLEVKPTVTLPHVFELEIPQRGAEFKCALMWSKEDLVGVKFLSSIGPMPDNAPDAEGMEDLRSENVQLREEIARLTARILELTSEP
jgi:hypothetical protein